MKFPNPCKSVAHLPGLRSGEWGESTKGHRVRPWKVCADAVSPGRGDLGQSGTGNSAWEAPGEHPSGELRSLYLPFWRAEGLHWQHRGCRSSDPRMRECRGNEILGILGLQVKSRSTRCRKASLLLTWGSFCAGAPYLLFPGGAFRQALKWAFSPA